MHNTMEIPSPSGTVGTGGNWGHYNSSIEKEGWHWGNFSRPLKSGHEARLHTA